MFRVDRISEVRIEGGTFRPNQATLLRAYIGTLETERADRAAAKPR